jgi:hypothetical protein
MSELLDALPDVQGRPHPSGTFSQAWSVAEFERNGFQDYLGFRPNLPRNQLHFVPALPAKWRNFDAVLPFGKSEELLVQAQRLGTGWRWRLSLGAGLVARELVFDFLDARQGRRRVAFKLQGGHRAVLEWKDSVARLNGRRLPATPVMASQAGVIGTLRFATPPPDGAANFPATRGRNVLQERILRGG